MMKKCCQKGGYTGTFCKENNCSFFGAEADFEKHRFYKLYNQGKG